MRQRTRGMTLTELIVYSVLAVLAGGLIWGLQTALRKTQHATSASSLMSSQTSTVISWLRRDLNETALASIQVYPNSLSPNEAPGLSCASRLPFNKGQQATGWDKHVLYTLDSEPGSQLGNLVRWERQIVNNNNLPVPCNVLPSSTPRSHSRVIARKLVRPDQTLNNVGPSGQVTTDETGGFSVKFIQRQNGSGGAESFTTVNPSQGDPRHRTRMMEVELKLVQHERRTHPDFFTLKFRVAAKH